jgi:hypothetical protein
MKILYPETKSHLRYRKIYAIINLSKEITKREENKMITNEERKKVATKLREKHCERQGTFEPQSLSMQALNTVEDLLDCLSCLPKRHDLLLDLADLIEPEPERG